MQKKQQGGRGNMGVWTFFGIVLIFIAALLLFTRISPICRKISTYTFLTIIAIIMIFPFYSMLVMSTHRTTDIMSFPPPLWFGNYMSINFQNMMSMVNFPQAFLNSVIISTGYTALVLLFCSMGGYAFAIYRFPGRNALFTVLIITMTIPWTAGIIPWFIMMSRFGWVNTYWALIIPGSANAFGIFWMRQYCTNNVPVTLMEAAKIDGCSEWLIFFRVIVPVLLPAFAALGIMQFVFVWNDFMQPLLILRSPDMYTLPLMLRYMQGDMTRGTDIGAVMMASTMVVLPLLLVFLCASKLFMSGLTAGAIKE
jgi:ABC-type glycerol-3-phosphate transport system permease component